MVMASEQVPQSSTAAEDSTGSRNRRTYERPRLLFQEPLEAMASICMPHPPAKQNTGLCPTGPISS
jgi:hypothetical protein